MRHVYADVKLATARRPDPESPKTGKNRRHQRSEP